MLYKQLSVDLEFKWFEKKRTWLQNSKMERVVKIQVQTVAQKYLTIGPQNSASKPFWFKLDNVQIWVRTSFNW